ncbi:uncharacterized protein MAM_06131 [Metarhizium album ARSEF 1941]|uniref:Uncharacterized protein n=1 Tax=Metarhizium album (strain ARSEF 1941) TaxID=1081103 RepID=A0A0B2WJ00_METAS|nr:uncharacterized protein MAM_06131 [Metarhizium album ARSEF 1941]KHN96026.1 hypothetical protein MAM_06131 [Metarhizium album ARSEF 1941]
MKFSVASAVAAMLAVAHGLPSAVPRELESLHARGGVTWTGEVLPGKNFTFSGTIQEVQAQILAQNPSYFDQYVNVTDSEPETHLERRWTEKQPPDCSYGHYMRRIYAVAAADGAVTHAELKAKHGGTALCGAPPRRGPGLGGCSRVSCSWGSQMWLCNDNDYHLDLPCTEVASALLELSNVCYFVQEGGDTQVQGQLFTTDNWNVIIDYYGDCHSSPTVG